MVCVYCSSETKVVNSRHQKKANQVWRRRECQSCGAVFTTLEGVDATQALRFQNAKHSEPFSRDKLLLSVYDSLRHRKTATEDATALTGTIMTGLYAFIQNATIQRDAVVEITATVLERFDKAAATSYRAFHAAG
jgi:transcriptional repressor NrdR